MQNEKLLAEIYDTPWYLMSTSSQKQVCAALHRLQNAGVLTIGPFAQLDFETAAMVNDVFSLIFNKPDQLIANQFIYS